jgi:hypothetical protein
VPLGAESNDGQLFIRPCESFIQPAEYRPAKSSHNARPRGTGHGPRIEPCHATGARCLVEANTKRKRSALFNEGSYLMCSKNAAASCLVVQIFICMLIEANRPYNYQKNRSESQFFDHSSALLASLRSVQRTSFFGHYPEPHSLP